MHTYTSKLALLAFSIMLSISAQAQFTVTANQTAQDLANSLTGLNVTVTDAVLTCGTSKSGIFTYSGAELPISGGVVLSTCLVADIAQPASVVAQSGDTTSGDTTLLAYSGITNNNACVLECDVVPDYDTLFINYSFASEEYPEHSCSLTDMFGIFLWWPAMTSGQSLSIIPNTGFIIPTGINSVNNQTINMGPWCTNPGPGSPFPQYYIDNIAGTDIVFDGMTVNMEAFAVVNPGLLYHMKFAVGNATMANDSLPSALFLEGGTLSSKHGSVTNVPGVSKSGKTVIYPNPVKGNLSVKIPSELDNQNITATVTNMMGQSVLTYSGKGSGLNDYLKTKQISAGSYIMNLKADGYHQVLRFQKD